MSPLNFDLRGAIRDPIKGGTVVTLRVDSVKHETATTGTEMAVWDFIVTDPMEDDPRHVYDNTMLTGKGRFRSALLLQALGVPFGDERPDLNGGFDDLEAIGKSVRAVLKVDDYEGVPRNKVEKYMPLI